MNFGHPNSETCQMLAELLSPQVIKFLRAMCAFPKQHRSGRVRDFIPWLGKTKKELESFNHGNFNCFLSIVKNLGQLSPIYKGTRFLSILWHLAVLKENTFQLQMQASILYPSCAACQRARIKKTWGYIQWHV